MSVFRPGTLAMCRALPRMICSGDPSSTRCTGIQYTPVLSMATCVHSRLSNHSRKRSSSSRNVPNVHLTTFGGLLRPSRQHATIFFLCTSRPAPTTTTTSMTASFHWLSKRVRRISKTESALRVCSKDAFELHQTVVLIAARVQPPDRGSLGLSKVRDLYALRHLVKVGSVGPVFNLLSPAVGPSGRAAPPVGEGGGALQPSCNLRQPPHPFRMRGRERAG